PPAVSLARPQEVTTLADPPDLVDDVDPGLRLVAARPRHLAARRVAVEEIVAIRQPVQLLDGHAPAVDPLEPREVVLPRIARDLHPLRRPSLPAVSHDT